MKEISKHLLLVGTYTDGKSKGIYSYSFDSATAAHELLGCAEVENPSYLAVSPDNKYIYSVSENPEMPAYVNSLRLESNGRGFDLHDSMPTGGAGPCYIAVDRSGGFAVTANYAGGNISVFPVAKDGRLQEMSQNLQFSGHGKDPQRQEAPHPHCIAFSPDGRYLFVTDLGTDRIYRFETGTGDFIKEGSKRSYDVEAGSGPRHIVFSATGENLYLINELSATVNVFIYSAGEIGLEQSLPVCEDCKGDGGDIAISPGGRFLYASLRDSENDGIGIFAIDESSGLLTPAGFRKTGRHPRKLTFSPDGRLLLCAAMEDSIIEIYSVSAQKGQLIKTSSMVGIDRPASMVFF